MKKGKISVGAWMLAFIPLLLILVIVIAFLVLRSQNQLSDAYDKQTIIETAEQMITDINVNGLEAVLTPLMREDYLEDYPMESMDEQVLSLLSGSGTFVAYSTETVVGRQSPDSDEEFAVILLVAEYEKDQISYTITFDVDMNVISFYAQ